MNNDNIEENNWIRFNDDDVYLKIPDLALISLFITSQLTGRFKTMFRFASHCFEPPVISALCDSRMIKHLLCLRNHDITEYSVTRTLPAE